MLLSLHWHQLRVRERQRSARDLQGVMRNIAWLLEPRSVETRDFVSRLRTSCQRLLAPAVV